MNVQNFVFKIIIIILIISISGCTQTSQPVVSTINRVSNRTETGQTAEEMWQDLQSKYEDTSECIYWDCFTKVAIHTNNYEICEEIEGDYRERSYCYYTMAIKIENQSLCENIEKLGSYEVIDKNYCKALASRNISLCSDVSSEDFKGYCNRNLLMDIAARTGNLSICEQLGAEHLGYKNSCYIKVALFSSNEGICDNIPKNEILANKIAHVECKAMVNKDSSMCDSLSTVVDRDNCYNKVALVEQDISICDKIERYFIKQECVDQIFAIIPFSCTGCNDLREEIYSFH